MAARYRRAERLGGIHVRVSRGSDDAWICLRAFVAGQQTNLSRPVGAGTEDSGHTAFLSRRLADSPTSGRTGLAARVAGRSAVYLSRGTRAGAGEDASQTGLPVPHIMGRDWTSARGGVVGRVGSCGKSSRRVGIRGGRSKQRQ